MTKTKTRLRAAVGSIVLIQALVGAGCAGKASRAKPAPVEAPKVAPAPAPTTQPKPTTRPAPARVGTLYERLGGEAVIRQVVDDFVARAVADPAVNFSRQGHATPWEPTSQNVERLKQRLVQFIATAGDGPAKFQYGGRDMVTAHRGMGITAAEFDALAGHLAAALEANDVPRREREELLSAVASSKGAIVEVTAQPIVAAPAEEAVPTAPASPVPDAGAPEAAAPAETLPVVLPPAEAKSDDVTVAEPKAADETADEQAYTPEQKEPQAEQQPANDANGEATTSDPDAGEYPQL